MKKPPKAPKVTDNERALVRADLHNWMMDLSKWIAMGLPVRPALTLAEAKRRRTILRAALRITAPN